MSLFKIEEFNESLKAAGFECVGKYVYYKGESLGRVAGESWNPELRTITIAFEDKETKTNE